MTTMINIITTRVTLPPIIKFILFFSHIFFFFSFPALVWKISAPFSRLFDRTSRSSNFSPLAWIFMTFSLIIPANC